MAPAAADYIGMVQQMNPSFKNMQRNKARHKKKMSTRCGTVLHHHESKHVIMKYHHRHHHNNSGNNVVMLILNPSPVLFDHGGGACETEKMVNTTSSNHDNRLGCGEGVNPEQKQLIKIRVTQNPSSPSLLMDEKKLNRVNPDRNPSSTSSGLLLYARPCPSREAEIFGTAKEARVDFVELSPVSPRGYIRVSDRGAESEDENDGDDGDGDGDDDDDGNGGHDDTPCGPREGNLEKVQKTSGFDGDVVTLPAGAPASAPAPSLQEQKPQPSGKWSSCKGVVVEGIRVSDGHGDGDGDGDGGRAPVGPCEEEGGRIRVWMSESRSGGARRPPESASESGSESESESGSETESGPGSESGSEARGARDREEEEEEEALGLGLGLEEEEEEQEEEALGLGLGLGLGLEEEEVEVETECECCGMVEECTRGYVRRTRGEMGGHWLCGLCTAAVHEEWQRLGARGRGSGCAVPLQAALRAHMLPCRHFRSHGPDTRAPGPGPGHGHGHEPDVPDAVCRLLRRHLSAPALCRPAGSPRALARSSSSCLPTI